MNSIYTWVFSALSFTVMMIMGLKISSSDQAKDAKGIEHENEARSSRRANVSKGSLSDAKQYMNRLRQAGSSKERMRATVAMAMTIKPEDFSKWVEGDLFTFCEGPELDIFRVIIFDRWLQEAPETLIPWADKNRHGQAYRALRSIAKERPELLLAYYRENPNQSAELLNLQWVAETQPSMALERLQELSESGISSRLNYNVDKLLRALAKHSLSELEAAVNSFNPKIKKLVEAAVIGRRLEVSFDDEIEKLFARQDGYVLFRQSLYKNRNLSGKLLARLDSLPEAWLGNLSRINLYYLINDQNAKEWLTYDYDKIYVSPSKVQEFRRDALKKMASKEPQLVLQNLSLVSERDKKDLIERVFSEAVGNDGEQKQFMSLLGSAEDQKIAQEYLEVKEVEQGLAEIQKPAEWLSAFADLKTHSANSSYNLLSRIGNWSDPQLKKLKSSYVGLSQEQQHQIARAITEAADHRYNLTYYDVEFSGEVIRSLVNNPISPDQGGSEQGIEPVSASTNYVAWLSEREPDKAASWLKSLPEGDAKLWGSINLAVNWKQYDAEAVKKWMKTLPLDTQAKIQEQLEK